LNQPFAPACSRFFPLKGGVCCLAARFDVLLLALVLPGRGHNIIFDSAMIQQLSALVAHRR
jgi:hypothetical protein